MTVVSVINLYQFSSINMVVLDVLCYDYCHVEMYRTSGVNAVLSVVRHIWNKNNLTI